MHPGQLSSLLVFPEHRSQREATSCRADRTRATGLSALALALAAIGVAGAQEPASRTGSRPRADPPQIELLPTPHRAMRSVYRSLDERTPWLVGADAVLASFESVLFRFQQHLADRHRHLLAEALPKALVEAARELQGWDDGRRQLVGALATAVRLLGEGPIRGLPEDREGEVEEEVADVVAYREAIPRFVRSLDPDSPSVAWSIAKPTGVYALRREHAGLFRAVVYLRHLDPTRLDLLAKDQDSRRTVRKMFADLRALELTEEAMWGRAVLRFWEPRRGGSVVPWVDPPERPVLWRLALEMPASGSAEPLELVRRWLTGEPTPAEQRGGSFRTLYLNSLRSLACATPGAWLGPAMLSDAWARHRLEAAAWGYNFLRQIDSLEGNGPVTGRPPVPEPLVFAEPVPDFYERMAEAAALLRLVVLATSTDRDGFVRWCEDEREFCEALLALCRAQRDGQPGDQHLQQYVRERVMHSLDAPDWRGRPEFALDRDGEFCVARGDCRAVRVQITWQGRQLTVLGGVVTVLTRGPGQAAWSAPSQDR